MHVRDFGYTWDENEMRMTGIYNLIYVAETFFPSLIPYSYLSFPKLANYWSNDHGPFMELIFGSIEHVFKINESRNIHLMRHSITFTVCFIGLINFYFLIMRRFKRHEYAILGSSILVLSPRIFADSFYNAKDLAFAALLVISLNSFAHWRNNKSHFTLLIHSIVCGFASAIRIIGIIMVIITLLTVIHDYWSKKQKTSETLFELFSHSTITFLILFICFPVLWSDPLNNVIEILSRMSNFPYYGQNLFNGVIYEANSSPWYYVPSWILITTPISYIILFLIGVFFYLPALLKFRFNLENAKKIYASDLACLIVILVPIAFAAIRNSVVYDGWRHFYFIYPPMVYFMLLGLQTTFGFLRKTKVLIFALILTLLFTLGSTANWMRISHPMENLYFNQLAGKKLVTKWEMDYWGQGNSMVLKWLIQRYPNKTISIAPLSNTPLHFGIALMSKLEASHFLIYKITPEGKFELTGENSKLLTTSKNVEPEFLFTNYRINRGSYKVPVIHAKVHGYRILKDFKVGNEIWATLYKKMRD